MNRITFAFFVLIFSGCSYPLSKIRVLHYPGEPLGNTYDSLDIKRVRVAYNSGSILVRLKDKRKIIVDPTTVWGILDRDSNLWRYYKGRFIVVRQLDTPTIYSVHHSVGKSSHTDYSFSKTPFSPIYGLQWKYIKREFAANTCFLSALNQLDFFTPYESYDRKNKSYKFILLYKACSRVRVP